MNDRFEWNEKRWLWRIIVTFLSEAIIHIFVTKFFYLLQVLWTQGVAFETNWKQRTFHFYNLMHAFIVYFYWCISAVRQISFEVGHWYVNTRSKLNISKNYVQCSLSDVIPKFIISCHVINCTSQLCSKFQKNFFNVTFPAVSKFFRRK